MTITCAMAALASASRHAIATPAAAIQRIGRMDPQNPATKAAISAGGAPTTGGIAWATVRIVATLLGRLIAMSKMIGATNSTMIAAEATKGPRGNAGTRGLDRRRWIMPAASASGQDTPTNTTSGA